MGLNALVFTAINALLLKGNAMSDVDGAAWIVTTTPQGGIDESSLEELSRVAAATHGVMDVAAFGRLPLAWRRGAASDPVWAQLVSADYFRLVGVATIAGRLPVFRTTGPPEIAVAERFWRQQLAAAPIGDVRLTLNGVEHAAVGVIPEHFRGPSGTFAPEIWTPLERWRELGLPETLGAADHRWLGIAGRISAGVSVAEVQTRVAAAAAHLASERPGTHAGRGARVMLIRDGHPDLRTVASIAAVAMAGTGLVLLLACFNLAGLLIARGVERQKEMGIRAAIGAGTRRLLRQLVIEGLVLSAASGIVTLVIAAWGQSLLSAFALPAPIPQRIDLSLDATTVAFVFALVLVAGVLPGLVPALHAARVDLVRALAARGGGSSRPSRARRALILTQVAGSAALLTGAALFVQSAARLADADPGFERTQAIVMALEPSLQGYDSTRARLLTDRIADRVRAEPGIVDVTVADRIPFYIGYPRLTPVARAPGQCVGAACPSLTTYAVGAGFFRTLGIPLLAGRELDRSTPPASVIVSETFARTWWPDASALDHVLYLGKESLPHLVIGVARDTRHRSLTDATPTPVLYVPLAAADFTGAVTLVARTDRAPGSLVKPAADAARSVDPGVPLQSVATMAERLRLPQWPAQTAMTFFAVCGGLALLLATIGLFAVVSHIVSQRTREFGVRLALGATRTMLLREVILSGARLVVPGTAAGLLIAVGASYWAAATLRGADVATPAICLAVALLQIGIALAACLVPARRAARVDPLISLRAE